MGIHTEYSCSQCDFNYEDSSDIFWIDRDGKVHVGILAIDSSDEASKALASGGIYNYYCYNCNKTIYNFHITEKSPELPKEFIIQLIEKMDDNLKIIDFDNRFQNCIGCFQELELKMEKEFVLDSEGEFHVVDEAFQDIEADFSGKYYGYFCRDCSRQINKFVIYENNAELEDSLIREILQDHTNDLTVFINASYECCPHCGDGLQVLGEDSLCPECRTGVLEIENQTFSD